MMRVSELVRQQEVKDKTRKLHSEEAIITSYRNGQVHYVLALKQLCHLGLSVQQAKSRLDNP
jgi:hypothetical protein